MRFPAAWRWYFRENHTKAVLDVTHLTEPQSQLIPLDIAPGDDGWLIKIADPIPVSRANWQLRSQEDGSDRHAELAGRCIGSAAIFTPSRCSRRMSLCVRIAEGRPSWMKIFREQIRKDLPDGRQSTG